MDAVYVCRDGDNSELRYSLRSLAQHVPHDRVHIVGGHPRWINNDTVTIHRRPVAETKFATTTSHIRYACNSASISDPFMLWNDDFYAITQVDEIPAMHRGPLTAVMRQYRHLNAAWAHGLRVTTAHLKTVFPGRELYSYEVHVPIVVHKTPMLDALTVASGLKTRAPHKRTIYGNVAQLGGVQIRDPKITRQTVSLPDGPWLSSDDGAFHSVVAPILERLFPDACRYEDHKS